MRIFILGCGYLGYNLSQLLKDLGHRATVLGIDSHYVQLCDDFKYVNVFDTQRLQQLVTKDSIVIDAVGLMPNNVKSDDEGLILKNLHRKYTALLQALQECKVKQFIYISSGGTLYRETEKPVSESAPLNPQTLYARSKANIESAVIDSGINYLILRLGNPFGGYQEPFKTQGVIPILIRKALLDEPFEMWAQLEDVRDYIHITDVVSAISGLIDNRINNEIINIGSGRGVSLAYLIDLVRHCTKKEININTRQPDIALAGSIVLDITKLRNLIGFEVQVPLEKGVFAEFERIEGEL